MKLSCTAADEKPRTLVEQKKNTTHGEDEPTMKSCRPRKETHHGGVASADVVSGSLGSPGGAPGTQDRDYWFRLLEMRGVRL